MARLGNVFNNKEDTAKKNCIHEGRLSGFTIQN